MTSEEMYLLECHAEGVKLFRLGERIPFEYADTMPDVCRNQGWVAAQAAGIEFGHLKQK